MHLDAGAAGERIVDNQSALVGHRRTSVMERATVVAALCKDSGPVSAARKSRNKAHRPARPFNARAPQLRLPTGTPLQCRNGQVDFAQTFDSQVRSNTLWLTSLTWLEPALDAAADGDTAALGFAASIARQFIAFVATPDGRRVISRNNGHGAVNHSFATRTRVLVRLLGLLRSPAMPVDHALVLQVAREIWISAEWLCVPQHRSPDNHGAMVDLALLDVGAVLPRPNAYVALATSRLADGAERLFDSDGYCRENSTAYHRLNLQFHERAIARIERLLGADNPNAIRLRAVCKHARAIVPQLVRDDGTMPPIGDGMHSNAVSEAGTTPVFCSAHLATARHDGSFLSLVCGHSLPFHKHVDDTAVTWRSGGTDILIDGGSFNYDRENPVRRCLESSLGHSGLGVEPMEEMLARQWCRLTASGAITRWEWDGAQLEARASFAVPTWDATLEREIAWTGTRLEVRDRVVWGYDAPGESRRVRQNWLFGPSLAFVGRREDEHSTIFEFFGAGKRVELTLTGLGHTVRVERGAVSPNGMRRTGWFSPRSNHVEPTWVVTVCRDGAVGTTMLSTTIRVDPMRYKAELPRAKPTPQAHKVSLARDVDSVVVEVDDPSARPETTYAVYLLRGSARVAVRGYEVGRRAVFPATAIAGVYTAKVFRRNGADVDSAYSLPLRIEVDGDTASRHAEEERLRGFPPARHIPSLDALSEQLDPEAMQRLDLRHGPFVYSLVKGRRIGRRLFVVLVGAIDRTRLTLPRFSRFSWRDEFPGTFVCVSDPTLQLDPALRLGWYFGTPAHDATQVILRVVEVIRERLGVSPADVCFYGSSGGGYAALQLAARSGRGATAIAINPQIEVLDYPSTRFVAAFRSTVLGGLDNAAARARHGVRLSALEAWRTPPADEARVLLVQNRADSDHYSGHYRAFADAFGIPDNGEAPGRRMATMVYDHPSGHAAEPRGMLGQIFGAAGRLQWRPAVTPQRATPQPSLDPKPLTMTLAESVAAIKPKQDFLNHTYISLRHGYMYAAVGKAANSTVKHHLYELEYRGTRFKTKSLHDRQSSPLLSPFQLTPMMLEDVLGSERFVRFTVVRNPYSRILSCYLDRIAPGNSQPYRQLIAAVGHEAGTAVGFDEFVRTICRQRPFDQNNHWRLQVAEICHGTIRYDEIGKQENFADDMARIWKRITRGTVPAPDFDAENKAPSITSAERRLGEFYTGELVDLVRRAYAADFEAFAYSRDPE